MLLLALLGAMPGASTRPVVAPLLAILAVQMMLGHAGPAFPRRVAERSVRPEGLARTLGRAVPMLRRRRELRGSHRAGRSSSRWRSGRSARWCCCCGLLLLAPSP